MKRLISSLVIVGIAGMISIGSALSGMVYDVIKAHQLGAIRYSTNVSASITKLQASSGHTYMLQHLFTNIGCISGLITIAAGLYAGYMMYKLNQVT